MLKPGEWFTGTCMYNAGVEGPLMPRIPAHALIFEGGKQYVVCVGTDNRLRVREVGVYKQTDEYCYLNAGLKEGDVVVNKNALLVYNAFKIRNKMHTFIDRIITFSLRNKFFIFFLTVIAVIAGAVSFLHTPVDAFPDVTNTKVTIITQWPGRSAEEIEKFITIPVEIAMNPVQKKTDIRSTTLFGLSVIHVMFDDDVDDFYARQQVYNLLNDADLPEGVTPEVQPLYGPTGEIFRYTLRSDKRTARELKTFSGLGDRTETEGGPRSGGYRQLLEGR